MIHMQYYKSLFYSYLIKIYSIEYGKKVVSVVHLNNDLYQAYVVINGSEVGYIV